VWFQDAPDGTFTDNALMGQPAFSAIQVQGVSTGVVVRKNWVEHGGPAGGIRIRPGSDNPKVEDNTIASASSNGINVHSVGGKFQNNTILAITDVGATSCLDGSTGSGTAGTGNNWKHNRAPVPSNPVGICGPIP
jgi:hypothetical protein